MTVQNSEMIIKLNSNNSDTIVTLTDSNGRVVEKCVSAEDLMSNLAAQRSLSTGILPSNTRFFKGGQNNYVLVMESPAKIRNFTLHAAAQAHQEGYKPRQLMIPFPNCVLIFKVVNRRLFNTWVYSTANKISSVDNNLCVFPYGNIYQDGHVCWGQVQLPEINSPQNLSAVVALFFDAPFNGDLTYHRTFTNPRNSDVVLNNFWDLVNYMDGKPNFPEEMLFSSGMNLNTAIQNV
jgi:hypothetical protein